MTLGLGLPCHRDLRTQIYKSLFASFSSEKEGSSLSFLGHLMTNIPLLTVDAISKRFTVGSLLSGTRAYLRAVDRVSFTVQRGETLALVPTG